MAKRRNFIKKVRWVLPILPLVEWDSVQSHMPPLWVQMNVLI
jgi:hypothetical protein